MAVLLAAAAALPHVVSASPSDPATAGGAMAPASAGRSSAVEPTDAGAIGLAVATPSTTTTVITPEDLCLEFGGPDCEAALAECDTLGPNACVKLVECLATGIVTQSAYFPFDCWPEQLGDPEVYLCRVFGCPGTPPDFCADPDVVRVGWCGPDGVLLQPGQTTTTTTTAPPTTAPPTTAPPTTAPPTTAPPTTAPPTTAPPTTAPATTAPATTAPATTAPATTAPPTTAPPTTAPATTAAPTTAPPATLGSSPTTAPSTTAVPTTTPPTTTDPAPVDQTCDPNYEGHCVPIAPSVDCADVPGTNVVVVGVDIYGLDGDNDGIGCEAAVTAQVASATTTPVSAQAAEADLALTGRSSTPLAIGGLLLLVTGLALIVLAAATTRTPRPGGYSFSSVDDFGFPTHYRVTGGRSRRRSARQQRPDR